MVLRQALLRGHRCLPAAGQVRGKDETPSEEALSTIRGPSLTHQPAGVIHRGTRLAGAASAVSRKFRTSP